MNTHLKYLAADCRVTEADVVLAGVPFDGTASFRPGARFGPNGIRAWSQVLETYSPAFDADLEDLELADAGDLEISSADWQNASGQIHAAADRFVRKGQVPIFLGGEHLITLPAVQACAEVFPDLVVVHMDAHMDLRDSYEGLAFSHATVMRRVMEIVGPGNLYQYGIRSGTREEWALSREHKTLLDGPAGLPRLAGERPVYLSIDLDVLDPSVMPETGTPEAGGITFTQLHEAVIAMRGLRIVAGDVVEYCPLPGGGPSGAVAAKVVRELVLLAAAGRQSSTVNT